LARFQAIVALQRGTRLGAYEITSLLGQGGMGQVYRAFDTTLQRPVAIKVLSEADEQARSKLLREARSASALSHPNVATVYEVGEHEDQPYIAMELVEGKPLCELLPDDGLPQADVLRYGLQIADGLAHAHEQGIVHRDLKSQNVVITPEGRAKVLDFGLAMRLEPQDAEAVTVTVETAGQEDGIVGTLAYMAPELLRGEPATLRSDVWALGVLLFELAASRHPFDGATRADLVSAIVREPVPDPPEAMSPGVRAVVSRCLDKEPARRYASATAVQAVLEALSTDSVEGQVASVEPAPSRPGGSKLLWVAAGAAIVAVAFAAGARPWSDTTVEAPVLRLTNPVQLTSGSFLVDSLDWSPDSTTLAYSRRNEGDVWVTRLDGQPLNRTVDHDGVDHYPAWSPDGQQIAFYSDRDGGGIFRMPELAGAPSRVARRTMNRRRPHWLSGGRELALVLPIQDGSQEIEIVDLDSGDSRTVRLPGTWRQRHHLRWSPDERLVAYMDRAVDLSTSARLWIYRMDDGEAFPVTDAVTWNHSPSWSPDGRTLYFVSNRGGLRDLWQQRVAADGMPEGEPLRVTAGVGLWRASLSPDGTKLAYVPGGWMSNVWRMPILPDRIATWGDAEQLTFGRNWIGGLAVSNDGSRLAIGWERDGKLDIWVMSSEGGEPQQLTDDPAVETTPSWSPDDEELVFLSGASGSRQLWAVPSAGGAARQLTTVSDGRAIYPDWSPDGGAVVYLADTAANSRLEVVDLETGATQVLSDEQSINWPTWSPDGSQIMFWGNRDNTLPDVRVVLPNGGASEFITGGRTPRWSPDGRRIYFIRQPGSQDPTLWTRSLDDGTERQLADLSGRGSFIYQDTFDTDGEYLYFGWREDQGDIWVMDVVQDDQ